jgi:hypothetical protein
MKKVSAFIFLLWPMMEPMAQILVTNPAFPTMYDDIEITYNANLGNGELGGVIPAYAHTGVITNLSESPNQWRHVVGNWGTADPEVVMQPLGNGKHRITINPSTFYDLANGEVVTQLAFVFRNVNGSLVGRNADGSDIFLPLYDGSFAAGFFLPEQSSQIIQQGESIDFLVQSSETSNINLIINGLIVSSSTGTSLNYTATAEMFGEYEVVYTADNGEEVLSDTMYYIVQPPVTIQNPPLGTQDGINYLSATSVILQLYAPLKDYVYVVGDFNDWELRLDYQMKRSQDGNRYWLHLDGLNPGEKYRFQYHINEEGMRIADIYSQKILDYWNDPWIPEESYPDLIPYPVGLTSEPVSVLQTNQVAYNWTDETYVHPPKEKLIIYELLVRDFLEEANYQALLDTLNYLDNLGVNAIQLMPVNEFEGNSSWGYNPSFYFAPDKYYGSANTLKDFVNECHNRGIAVILDIALNHSFGQNPQVRMYFDASIPPYGEPTLDNPWFNKQPRHDFNVGYDYNHESPHTRSFCKRVLQYWVEEFHIDGYRLDLSKGFTQNNTLGDIAGWAVYDQSRINILSDYGNYIWGVEPSTYIILEHFANNDEETVLSNMGFMLWGNVNAAYGEAVMGYSGNFSSASYQSRGWSSPNLVSYMESHDEERIAYKLQEFGNSSGGYNTREEETAMQRMELGHVFLLPIPGPKMIWQFGEAGYDYSLFYCPNNGLLNENCKTDPKPVRWDYLDEPARIHLYKVISALNHLKTEYPAFSTTDYDIDFGGMGKRLHLNHSSMNVTIIGNFGVTPITMIPGFQHTGTWHEYFTGSTIVENNLANAFYLEPGEYRLYTDIPLPLPDLSTEVTGIEEDVQSAIIDVYPNPFGEKIQITLHGWQNGNRAMVRDTQGRLVAELKPAIQSSGRMLFEWNGENYAGIPMPEGVYILSHQSKKGTQSHRLVLKR